MTERPDQTLWNPPAADEVQLPAVKWNQGDGGDTTNSPTERHDGPGRDPQGTHRHVSMAMAYCLQKIK